MAGSRGSESRESIFVVSGYDLFQSIGQELKVKEIIEATQPLRRKEVVESQRLICINWKEGKRERDLVVGVELMLFYLRGKCCGRQVEESLFLIASSFSVKWEVSRAGFGNQGEGLKKQVKVCNSPQKK